MEKEPIAVSQEDEGSMKAKFRWTENEDRLLKLATQVGWWWSEIEIKINIIMEIRHAVIAMYHPSPSSLCFFYCPFLLHFLPVTIFSLFTMLYDVYIWP